MTPWRKWFAWHPVRTPSGIKWLVNVMRRWNPDTNFEIIDPYDPGQYDGAYEYKDCRK